MKTRSFPALVALLVCGASLLMTGCASKKNTSDAPAPSGIYSTPDTFSPLPMNQAERTDAMRQKYRDEFR
jgi:ABC-type oligopeptide transport system substrate-binding subunit